MSTTAEAAAAAECDSALSAVNERGGKSTEDNVKVWFFSDAGKILCFALIDLD